MPNGTYGPGLMKPGGDVPTSGWTYVDRCASSGNVGSAIETDGMRTVSSAAPIRRSNRNFMRTSPPRILPAHARLRMLRQHMRNHRAHALAGRDVQELVRAVRIGVRAE